MKKLQKGSDDELKPITFQVCFHGYKAIILLCKKNDLILSILSCEFIFKLNK